MITVQEFMDLYNAAIEGKTICRKITHRGYIEDYYEHEEVNFLNLPMDEVIQHPDENSATKFEYYVKTW